MRQAKIPAVAAALRKGQSSHKQQAERARPDQGQSQGHLSNMLPERGRGRARITSSSRWRCAPCASSRLQYKLASSPLRCRGEPWQTSRCTRYSQLCDQSWHSRCARPRSCLLPLCLDLQIALDAPGPRLAAIGKRLEPGKPWVPRAKKPKIDRNS